MRVYEASLAYNLVQLGDDVTVDSPTKVVEYLKSAFAANPMQESFWVILLDRKNHAIGRVMTSLGTLTSTSVHPRDVFKPAILASAAAIVVAHNHPSGNPEPSGPDRSYPPENPVSYR
jgi:DNA repair protein RadC